jgi:DNA polymerase-1
MVRIPGALAAANLSSARMLLQVHDELVFEAAEGETERLIKIARSVMEKAAEPALVLSVPIHVDAKAASNWDEAH